MQYINNEDNSFKQEKTINGVDYSLLYKPTDIMVHQELVENYTKEEVNLLREKYNKYMYFTLSMAKNNQELLTSKVGSKEFFGAMVNQLSFGMGDKVHLITDTRDSIPLADYVYPRMYGMGGSTTILFVYPRDKKVMKSDYLNFTIEDLGFGTGEVGFKLKTRAIKNEPTLKFNL
ncbi:MAG: hypothetical protein ACSHW4_09595 [Cellulophaga sp.]